MQRHFEAEDGQIAILPRPGDVACQLVRRPLLGAVPPAFPSPQDKGGRFENGVYKGFKPDGSPKNRDSYEAIWEAHEGRELEFPAPRYRDPVMMLAKNYRFWPDRRRPGVAAKHLGTFSEARTGISFLRLGPGAVVAAGTQEDAELRYCTAGAFAYDGKTFGRGAYMFVRNGARTQDLRAAEATEFFVITLPMLADLAALSRDTGVAHPAALAQA